MKKIVFCFILCVAFTTVSLGQSKIVSYTKIGDSIPKFAVKDTENKTFDTSELKGKLLFINFWATWCVPCVEEMPSFENQVWLKHKDSPNFRMLAIARQETNEIIMPFVKEFKLTFPIAADSDRAIYNLFGNNGIPRSYIVGPEGKIIFQLVGFNSLLVKEMIALIDSEMAKFETKGKSKNKSAQSSKF
jgi:peroxiredoxin